MPTETFDDLLLLNASRRLKAGRFEDLPVALHEFCDQEWDGQLFQSGISHLHDALNGTGEYSVMDCRSRFYRNGMFVLFGGCNHIAIRNYLDVKSPNCLGLDFWRMRGGLAKSQLEAAIKRISQGQTDPYVQEELIGTAEFGNGVLKTLAVVHHYYDHFYPSYPK